MLTSVKIRFVVATLIFCTAADLPGESDLPALKKRVSAQIEQQKLPLYKRLKAAPGEMLLFDVPVYKNAAGSYWTPGPIEIWQGKPPPDAGVQSTKKCKHPPPPDRGYTYSVESSYMFGVQLEGATVHKVAANRPVKGTLFLTFDDGPGKGTSAVLQTLKETNIKATFFLLGNSAPRDQQKEVLNQIIADGHRFGNHTFTHFPSTVSEYQKTYSSPLTEPQRLQFRKNYADNLEHFSQLAAGPLIFRIARLPGHGKMLPELVQETQTLGLRHYGWDWEFAPPGTLKHVNYANWKGIVGVSADHPQDSIPAPNSILLLHDSHWSTNPTLVKTIIEHLQCEGYNFQVLAD